MIKKGICKLMPKGYTKEKIKLFFIILINQKTQNLIYKIKNGNTIFKTTFNDTSLYTNEGL